MKRRGRAPWPFLFLLALLPALLAAPGCAPAPPDEEALARVLELEDARIADPARWEPLLAHQDELVRAYAARGMGRVRAAPLAPSLLARLEAEERGAVREEIVFALGQLGDPAAAGALVGLLEPLAGRESALAVEALGKLGDPYVVAELVKALGEGDATTRGAAAGAIARLYGRRALEAPAIPASVAERILAALGEAARAADDELRWRAYHALSELRLEGRAALLMAGLRDDEGAARLFALRGIADLLGPLEGEEGAPRVEAPRIEVAEIAPLLEDPNVHVAAGAAGVLARLGGETAREALVEAARRREPAPSAFHVRAAALAALAEAFPATPALVAAFEEGLEDASPTVRERALVGLARVAPGQAAAAVAARLEAAEALTRVAAARAASALVAAEEAQAWLVGLLDDPDARVAVAALEGLAAQERFEDAALAAARRLAGAEDVALRTSALALLAEAADPLDLPLVAAALAAGSDDPDALEARLAAVDAAAAIGGEEALALLERAAGDDSPALRARARERAAALGARLPPPRGETDPRRSSVSARPSDLLPRHLPMLHFETSAGPLTLELLLDEAPRHVRSIARRAGAGELDGLRFHRVVTGFVVQGLDPRGDGWGSGGVFLRDEINPESYVRGAVGMPNAGPDSGGVQLFAMLEPAPHLDGSYTLFARVVEHEETLDAIDLDTSVTSAELIGQLPE